jgi:hypothetical protein
MSEDDLSKSVVYLVRHSYEVDNDTGNDKLIGVYSTRALACIGTQQIIA